VGFAGNGDSSWPDRGCVCSGGADLADQWVVLFPADGKKFRGRGVSMSDTVIKVENLGKKYMIGGEKASYRTLRESLMEGIKAPFQRTVGLLRGESYGAAGLDQTVWALKDVNFDVKQGEVVGVIGPNGAGKSTLLKILSRITEPTEGRALIRGRVGSLLEVGTGFHPELTGRENIYLHGSILGMPRGEIEHKFDEIVDFSGVEKFLDTPVKHYSSGMYVRLAFSVAAHLDTEVLIVDEVLAVGDASFQKKCLGKMENVTKQGRTILFVSHNMAAITNLCQRGIVLDQGSIITIGEIEKAVPFYLQYLNKGSDSDGFSGMVEFESDPNKSIQFNQIILTDAEGQIRKIFDYQENLFVNLSIRINKPNSLYYTVIFVQDMYGNMVFLTSDDDSMESPISKLECGDHKYSVKFPSRLLKPGMYQITVSLTQKYKDRAPHDRRDSVLSFEIIDRTTRRGKNMVYRKSAVVAPEICWELFTNQTNRD